MSARTCGFKSHLAHIWGTDGRFSSRPGCRWFSVEQVTEVDPETTCRVCGAVRPDRRDFATRCDACLRRAGRAAWLIPILLGPLGALALSGADLAQWVPAAIGLTVGLIIGWPLCVVVHEAGHALAGRAVGMRVSRFVVGNGPLIGGADLGSVKLELRRYQGIGSAWAATLDTDRYRNQWTIFSLGGPSASAVAAAIAFLLGGRSGLGAVFVGLAITNAAMAAVTMRPGRGFGGAVSSDVNDLLRVRAMSDDEVRAEIAYEASQRVLAAEAAGRIDDAVQIARAFVTRHPDAGDTTAWFNQALGDLGAGGHAPPPGSSR